MSASAQSRRAKALTLLVAAGCIALQVGRRLDLAVASAALWLVVVALADRVALRRLAMPRFWTVTALFALGSGLLLGPRDLDLLGLRLSGQGLEAGALMVCRGVFIFAFVSWLSRAIDGAATARLARRVGLGELGVAVASAWSVLPGLRDELLARRAAEGAGSSRGRLRRVGSLVVDVLGETARLADRLAAERGAAAPAALVLVEGPRGAGKTTAVTALAAALRERGLSVGGVAQPALESGGERVGYELLDVGADDLRPFARRKESGRGFDFDEEGWRWAAERLEGAQRERDVVVVDELGLLESRGEGHLPGLGALVETPGRAAVLVAAVREGCAAAVVEALGEPLLSLRAPADEEALGAAADEIVAAVAERQGGRGREEGAPSPAERA